MKKHTKFFLSGIFCFILIAVFAQQEPPDTGTGGGGGGSNPGTSELTCYNTYQTGGNWVINKCNGCAQVNRVKAILVGSKSTCTK